MSRQYKRSELVADGIIHGMGIVASTIACYYLINQAIATARPALVAAIILYCMTLIASFTVSGAYNLWPWTKCMNALKRADHAAIFVKIAGTYTPLVIIIGSAFSYLILALIWMVAIGGAFGKLLLQDWPKRISIGLYLALGWAAVLLLKPMVQNFTTNQILLIGLGGVLYTVGTVFYSRDQLKFQTAIWHGFVLSASACFFAAISLAI